MNTLLLTLLIVLIAAPITLASVTNDVNIKSSGGSSNVNVKINNNVNAGSNTVSTNTTSATKTNVEIHQSGEGISKVNINGKEWKLEGPGNISVSEESTPQPSSSPSASPSAIATPSVTPQELDEAQKNVLTQIIKALQQLIERLQNLF